MNTNHTLFTEPYKRVMATLSYIRGLIIDDWVQDMIQETKNKVSRANNPVPKTEEVLWTDWIAAFKLAYTDTAIKQNSYRDMRNLKMKGDRLDNDIARFKHLATEAGLPLDDPGTLEIFVSKFPIHLLTTISSRGDNVFNPDTATFAQWSRQARNEMKNSVRNTNILRNAWPSAWQVNLSSSYKPTFGQRSHQSHHTSHRGRNDETVPMDVDVARKAITTEQNRGLRSGWVGSFDQIWSNCNCNQLLKSEKPSNCNCNCLQLVVKSSNFSAARLQPLTTGCDRLRPGALTLSDRTDVSD
jgi:hypothetical protein